MIHYCIHNEIKVVCMEYLHSLCIKVSDKAEGMYHIVYFVEYGSNYY